MNDAELNGKVRQAGGRQVEESYLFALHLLVETEKDHAEVEDNFHVLRVDAALDISNNLFAFRDTLEEVADAVDESFIEHYLSVLYVVKRDVY